MSLLGDLARLSQELSECPHPNKKRWHYEWQAQNAADHIGGLKPYKCVCGMWHNTTDTSPEADPPCPVCGAPGGEWGPACGCYEEIHYGD